MCRLGSVSLSGVALMARDQGKAESWRPERFIKRQYSNTVDEDLTIFKVA